jgi:hypothetical protein
MTTLEMVQLRSMMPPSGLLTLRHAIPPYKQFPLEDTTPQVPQALDEKSTAAQETTVGKGGEAR